MRIKKTLIGLLYPKRCPVCHDVVEDKGELVCRICRTKLPLVRQPACRKCGKPLLEEEREYCQDCTRKHHEYRQGRAAFIYDERMRRSIAKFKYEGRRGICCILRRRDCKKLWKRSRTLASTGIGSCSAASIPQTEAGV